MNILIQEQVDKETGIAGFYNLAQKYLYDIGFEYVALKSEEKAELEISLQSYCEFLFGCTREELRNKRRTKLI